MREDCATVESGSTMQKEAAWRRLQRRLAQFTGDSLLHMDEEETANDAVLHACYTDAELIGASMYEVESGNKQGPFHTHHANEEWAIVLRGEPTLRTHEGEQQLRQASAWISAPNSERPLRLILKPL